jgi:phage terminase large subunit-like protein
LGGEILDDTPGALWTLATIDAGRVVAPPRLSRIVVAIDPAVTSNEDSDETGIVVAGRGRPLDKREEEGYVLEDCSQTAASPDAWMRVAVDAYYRHKADRIVAEVNNGGELVEALLRTVDRNVPFTAVHASRGKQTRAEPVAALYEQLRVHHCGNLAALEDQMTTWAPALSTKSPDRMDALVWGLTDLMLTGGSPGHLVPIVKQRPDPNRMY